MIASTRAFGPAKGQQVLAGPRRAVVAERAEEEGGGGLYRVLRDRYNMQVSETYCSALMKQKGGNPRPPHLHPTPLPGVSGSVLGCSIDVWPQYSPPHGSRSSSDSTTLGKGMRLKSASPTTATTLPKLSAATTTTMSRSHLLPTVNRGPTAS